MRRLAAACLVAAVAAINKPRKNVKALTAREFEKQRRERSLATTKRAMAAEAELTRTRSEHTEHLRLISASLDSSAKRSGQRQWDIVDTKLLQKPKSLKCEQDRWPTWSFKLLAYIAALDNKLFQAMTHCAMAAEGDVVALRRPPRAAPGSCG